MSHSDLVSAIQFTFSDLLSVASNNSSDTYLANATYNSSNTPSNNNNTPNNNLETEIQQQQQQLYRTNIYDYYTHTKNHDNRSITNDPPPGLQGM